MSWDMNHRDAMAQAARDDIPPADADKMWTKYIELGLAVRAGTMTDREAKKAFGEFCSRLAARTTMEKLGFSEEPADHE